MYIYSRDQQLLRTEMNTIYTEHFPSRDPCPPERLLLLFLLLRLRKTPFQFHRTLLCRAITIIRFLADYCCTSVHQASLASRSDDHVTGDVIDRTVRSVDHGFNGPGRHSDCRPSGSLASRYRVPVAPHNGLARLSSKM